MTSRRPPALFPLALLSVCIAFVALGCGDDDDPIEPPTSRQPIFGFEAGNGFTRELWREVNSAVVRSNDLSAIDTVSVAPEPGTATPGVDFSSATQRVIFDVGETRKALRSLVLLDAETEAQVDESYALVLSGPSAGSIEPTARRFQVTVSDEVPGFALPDVNSNSPSHKTDVAPSQYLQKVSAWYFGHAT